MGLDESRDTEPRKSTFVIQEVMCFSKLISDFLTVIGFADSSKSPRGIRGFQLNSGHFGVWKVQGKVGGYKK